MASLTNEPETFQHYQVMRREDGALWELGRGAMGVTYKAFDMNLRAPVALKVINALHLDSETSRARFVREARAAAGLRHRNVASVYHLGHDDQSFFYAMEFVDGDTVEGLVKSQGPLRPAIALQIALQVSRALGAAAKQQLVHRDIKPANLMVVTEDEDEDQLIVKVIDFGLARPALGGEGSANITMGGFVGTPQYASPEQLEEKELDARSDIYSLGITLWYMLVGKAPFSGPLGSVFIQQLTKEPPWAQLSAPEPVKKLLAHMLAKEPEKRQQSPTELRREIEACLKRLPSDTARIVIPHSAPVAEIPRVEPKTSDSTLSQAPSEELLTLTPQEAESAGLTSAQTAAPTAGTLLAGRYALVHEAGEGNNGRVFLAKDLEDDDAVVAVKIFHHGVVEEPAEVSRLKTNLRKLRASPHPNLVRFAEFHKSTDTRFLVAEWIKGFSLVELLRVRGKVTAREALQLLEQAASAADHAKNVRLDSVEFGLHQILVDFPEAPMDETGTSASVKSTLSQNIDRWPEFTVKLDASGIFRQAGDSVTPPGDMTMLPRSPGLERDTQTSIRGLVADSHVFSLAALTYELLNGAPPAQNRHEEGRDSRYVALSALNEAANALLRQALSPNPGFSTGTEFYSDLLEASGYGERAIADDIAPPAGTQEVKGTSSSDSIETLVINARLNRAEEPASDESSAETLIHDEILSEGSSAAETITAAETVAAATAVPAHAEETVVAPETSLSFQRHAGSDEEAADVSEAATLQGYSFISRGPVVTVPAGSEAAEARAPIVEQDDYGSDESEAKTLQGFSFKRPVGDKDEVKPLSIEIVRDTYGLDDVEAPTVTSFDFKSRSDGAPTVVPPVDPPAVYGEEDPDAAEARTLEGYSFKEPLTGGPSVVVLGEPPAVAEDHDSDAPEARTFEGYGFKARPTDGPGIIVPAEPPPATHDDLDPDAEASADAPTLQDFSFKSAPVDQPAPAAEPTAATDVPHFGQSSAVSPELDSVDAPTLEGYSFKTGPADLVLPPPVEKLDRLESELQARADLPRDAKDDPAAAVTLLNFVLDKPVEPSNPPPSHEDAAATLLDVPIHKEAASESSALRTAPVDDDEPTARLFDPPPEKAALTPAAHADPFEDDDAGATLIDAPVEKLSQTPELRAAANDFAAATLVDIPITELPSRPVPDSEFLKVADAPLTEVPPGSSVETENRSAASSSGFTSKPEPVEQSFTPVSKRGTDEAPVPPEFSDDDETLEPAFLPAAKETRPALVERKLDPVFTDRQLDDEIVSKPPNYALIGSVAAVIVFGIIAAVVLMRGKPADVPAPKIPVVMATPAIEKKPVTPDHPSTPWPVAVQPTPGPTAVPVVQATPAREDFPPVQTPQPSAAVATVDQPPATVVIPFVTPEPTPFVVNVETPRVTPPENTPRAEKSTPRIIPPKIDKPKVTRSKGDDGGDDDPPNGSTRRTTQEAKQRSEESTPRPVAVREPKPTPERTPIVKQRDPKPEPTPKPVNKKPAATPKPTAEPETRRVGPGVPFMR